jgi:hypothetical protein
MTQQVKCACSTSRGQLQSQLDHGRLRVVLGKLPGSHGEQGINPLMPARIGRDLPRAASQLNHMGSWARLVLPNSSRTNILHQEMSLHEKRSCPTALRTASHRAVLRP